MIALWVRSYWGGYVLYDARVRRILFVQNVVPAGPLGRAYFPSPHSRDGPSNNSETLFDTFLPRMPCQPSINRNCPRNDLP